MAARRPLVALAGGAAEIPAGDAVALAAGGTGATTAPAARAVLGIPGAGVSSINGNASLLAGAVGLLVQINGAFTVTLPAISAVPSGKIFFVNIGPSPATIAAAGSDKIYATLTGMASLTLRPGQAATLDSDGTQWIASVGAAAGANSDITSLSSLTTPLSVGQGGTGASTAGGARSSLGAAASGANTDITSLAGPALGAATATSPLAGDSSTQVPTTSFLTATTLRGDLAQSLTATYQGRARSNIAAAASGANGDITALTGLTTPLSPAQGGTGTTTAAGELARLGLGPMAIGQCRLVYSSASGLYLQPFNGNQLFINGAFRTLALSATALSNADLSAGQANYVYAFWNGSAVQLVATSVGHYTDPAYGHEILNNGSNDAANRAYTLVGGIYTGPGSPGTFVDTPAQRLVASWFNRPPRRLLGTMSGSSTGSSSPVSLSYGQRVTWFGWADEVVDLAVVGTVYASAMTGYMNTYAYVDGAVVGASSQHTSGNDGAGNPAAGVALARATVAPGEGYHYADAYGDAHNANGNWYTNIVGGILQ